MAYPPLSDADTERVDRLDKAIIETLRECERPAGVAGALLPVMMYRFMQIGNKYSLEEPLPDFDARTLRTKETHEVEFYYYLRTMLYMWLKKYNKPEVLDLIANMSQRIYAICRALIHQDASRN